MTTYTTAFVGCKVSQADCEAAASELAAAGLVPARGDAADVAVVMTCCVTAEAERKSRRLANHLARRGARVVVAGCASRLRPEQFRGVGIATLDERLRIGPRGSVGLGGGVEVGVGTRVERDVAAPDAVEARGGPAGLPALVEKLVGGEAGETAGRDGVAPCPAARTRLTLKIQDGCGQVCSYCAVRLARGTPASVPLAGVVERARRGVTAGCGEVVLTGVDLGAYRDEASGADLADVVATLSGLPGLRRLRLSSLEPGHLTPGLLDALAHRRVARHLHVPLQSADDRVLASMARPYMFAEYLETLTRARDTLGDVAFTTDVIVGFPVEDEDAFTRTLAAIGGPPAEGDRDGGLPVARSSEATRRSAGGLFERVHVFSYSRRPGTPAEALGTLAATVVKERMGRPAEVLLEERRDGLWRGYSSHYVRYYLEGDGERGELVRAVGDETFADGLKGRIV